MIESDMQIFNQSRKCMLVTQVQVAASFWRRLRGWMFHPPIHPDQGLYIKPCKGVHTWAMRFPIRALYISRTGMVINAVTLQPWQKGPWIWQCRGVLELPLSSESGEICSPGDQLIQIYGNGW